MGQDIQFGLLGSQGLDVEERWISYHKGMLSKKNLKVTPIKDKNQVMMFKMLWTFIYIVSKAYKFE